MDCCPAEAVHEEPAHKFSVVDIEPLGSGDEGTVITRRRVLDCGQEEVHVKTGELARRMAAPGGCSREPCLPARAEQVVSNVRGIAQEQGRRLGIPQACLPKVLNYHSRAVGETGSGKMRSREDGSKGIDFDGQKVGSPKTSAGSDQEPGGSSARVNYAVGLTFTRSPLQHRTDHRHRCVGRALTAPVSRRPQPTEGAAQGIKAVPDRPTDRGDQRFVDTWGVSR